MVDEGQQPPAGSSGTPVAPDANANAAPPPRAPVPPPAVQFSGAPPTWPPPPYAYPGYSAAAPFPPAPPSRGSRTWLWVLVGGAAFFVFVLAVFAFVYVTMGSTGEQV